MGVGGREGKAGGWGFALPLSRCSIFSPYVGKKTGDDSELKPPGLHSAVRFLSVVLAPRASQIPAFF